MSHRSENVTAGLVVAMTIGIACTLAMLSITPPGGVDDAQQRTQGSKQAVITSWESYRDTKCSLVKAEVRPGIGADPSAERRVGQPVRVWRCPHHQLFDEVSGAVPANWTAVNSQSG